MKKLIISAMIASIAAPVAIPTADARSRTYHGRHYHYHHCRHSSGTTGLVAGGAGGALLGNALIGGPVATIAGAAGGALLGRHLDKRHDAAQNRRNGC